MAQPCIKMELRPQLQLPAQETNPLWTVTSQEAGLLYLRLAGRQAAVSRQLRELKDSSVTISPKCQELTNNSQLP